MGLRLSPVTPANDAQDPQPQPLFEYVVEQLAPLNLAYLHIIEGASGGARDHKQGDKPFDYGSLRATYRNTDSNDAWMVNNGYNTTLANQALTEGVDLIAFGRPFIAKPDLTRHLREGSALNNLDRATLYGGGAKGYIDYPALARNQSMTMLLVLTCPVST